MTKKDYEEAPHTIPATVGLLSGYFGPVLCHFRMEWEVCLPEAQCSSSKYGIKGPSWWVYRTLTDSNVNSRQPIVLDCIVFDPMRSSVRDHMIRNVLSQEEEWIRDRKDGEIQPWKSAGLVACSVTRKLAGRSVLQDPVMLDPDTMLLPYPGDGMNNKPYKWSK